MPNYIEASGQEISDHSSLWKIYKMIEENGNDENDLKKLIWQRILKRRQDNDFRMRNNYDLPLNLGVEFF